MAPTYKLTYFNSRGLAEPMRYMFAYAGVKYEDVRLEKADWPTLKAAYPFGKVPTLEIDGKVVHQSQAICRYLATLYKLNGDTAWDAMQADIVVDTLGDLKTQAMDYFRLAIPHAVCPADEEKKAKLKEVLMKETLPFFLTKFDLQVKENAGYFVNGKLTWADFVWSSFAEMLVAMMGEEMCKEVFKNYPHLAALKAKVESIPAIKTWIETRPKTAM